MRRLLALLALVAVAGCGGVRDRLSTGATGATTAATATPQPVASGEPTPTPVGTVSASAQPPPSGYPRPRASAGTTSSPRGESVTLTNRDSGRTIAVTVGTVIRVRLQPELGNYDPPTSSAAAVRRESSSGGYPGGDPVDATFTAVSAGGADLSSTTDAQCLHSQPRCMIPQKQWLVHVVVR